MCRHCLARAKYTLHSASNEDANVCEDHVNHHLELMLTDHPYWDVRVELYD